MKTILLFAIAHAFSQEGEWTDQSHFEKQPAYKSNTPIVVLEVEPLRTGFWWAQSAYEEPPEEDPVIGFSKRLPSAFPTLTPIATATVYIGNGRSLTATYLLDFEFLGGWGMGGGFGIHDPVKKLRGLYWGGKGYYLNLGEYGNSFRAYGEVGNRFIIFPYTCATLGAALGYGNNGINTSDGATYGLMAEIQVRIGTWF